MPGYARVDLAGSYRFQVGQSAVVGQVNIENLFDKEYFLSADGRPSYARISTLPGAARTVLASVPVEF